MTEGTVIDIYSATCLGDRKRVQAILRRKPSLLNKESDDESVWRVTVLHYAVAGGSLELTQSLIDQGAFFFEPFTRLLVRHGRGEQLGGWELFNLVEDVSETTDLADQHPDKLRELIVVWEQFDAEMVAPAFR